MGDLMAWLENLVVSSLAYLVRARATSSRQRGGYASLGFIFHVNKIKFNSIIDKVLYGLVIFHLGGSVIMHGYSLLVQNNNWMGVFSMEYSYFALLYFIGLGLYCKSLSKRIDAQTGGENTGEITTD